MDLLGMKELYEVQLKANFPMELLGRTLVKGEPIALFDSIQTGSFEEVSRHVAASGGVGNQPRVFWNTTKEVAFNFTQGVFSQLHLALLGNHNITSENQVAVPKVEALETDEASKVELRCAPIENTLFLYDKDGTRLTNYTLLNKVITFTEYAFKDIQVFYDFLYNDGIKTIEIGRALLNGAMELSGKTRLKDDKTGQVTTGIFKIPKFKLMSDLSIRLGQGVSPTVAKFHGVGFPVGSRGQERVMDFLFLNDDIDSDM